MENGCSARYELYFQDVIFYKTLLWKYLWQTEVRPLRYFERKCAHVWMLFIYIVWYALHLSLLCFSLWYTLPKIKRKINKFENVNPRFFLDKDIQKTDFPWRFITLTNKSWEALENDFWNWWLVLLWFSNLCFFSLPQPQLCSISPTKQQWKKLSIAYHGLV